MDADLRTTVTAPRTDGLLPDPEHQFMNILGLEGSILEDRAMEDILEVDCISTAKLFMLANQNGIPILDIDSTNIDTLLPTLTVSDEIKTDIENSINQHCKVRIPDTSIVYEDWAGIGYIKKDPGTSGSGWMLAGGLEGAMTALSPDQWGVYADTLSVQYNGPVNQTPEDARFVSKLPLGIDEGTAGLVFPEPLRVLVEDRYKNPVKGATVTFSVQTGGGSFGNTQETAAVSNEKGIAQTTFYPQIGANMVDAFLVSGESLVSPFVIYGTEKTAIGDTPDELAVEIEATPLIIDAGRTATLTWTAHHADAVSIDQGIGNVDVSGSVNVSPDVSTVYTITATGDGGTVTDSQIVSVRHYPRVTLDVTPSIINTGETVTLTWSADPAQIVYFNHDIGKVASSGSLELTPEYTTVYTMTAINRGVTIHHDIAVKVLGQTPEPLPEGSFGAMYNDLIPDDASLPAYDTKRYILVTGRVKDASGDPLAGVTTGILHHSEYGTAQTDEDGLFTLPAEGGGVMTLTYDMPGYLPAQRKTSAPYNDLVIMDPVTLLQRDTVSTTVVFDGSPETVITHRGSMVSDDDGDRSATMVFTGDNTAYETDRYGNRIRALSSITTRVTEYATPASMPAKLPPTSAFTYCAEFEADGIDRVAFDKPVAVYVNNFLGFDVGYVVPVGFYDRDQGQWIESKNGVVVRLLDTDADGIVDGLDIDDDGQPDDLDNDGDTQDEAVGLTDPQAYPPGGEFWRVEMTHFTPWDFNPCSSKSLLDMFGYGSPIVDVPGLCEKKNRSGSYVNCESRIFNDDIKIPGTDLMLHYAADRVRGFDAVITVPASGQSVPSSLERIIVKLEIAGRTFTQEITPPADLANQTVEFVWDGQDALGRRVTTPITAHASVGYVYGSHYMESGYFLMAFAYFGAEITEVPTRDEAVLWRHSDVTVNQLPEDVGGIADGWTLSAHHYMSPVDPTILHKGDGSFLDNPITLIDTVAGTGEKYWALNDEPMSAMQSAVSSPAAVLFDPEGNLYIASQGYPAVHKVDTGGNICTIAGGPYAKNEADGIPATEARLHTPTALAMDAEGNLYIADAHACRVRKIDRNGIITTVAGNGLQGDSGDGGPATSARIFPTGVAVDPNGFLYIADKVANKVRKVDKNGIINTIAGTGETGFFYEVYGIPAIATNLYGVYSVSVDAEGNIYIPGSGIIRKVDPAGIITCVAGVYETFGYSGDNGPADHAQLGFVYNIVFDSDGNLYFSQANHVPLLEEISPYEKIYDWEAYDSTIDCVRKIDANGIITTVAGTGPMGFAGDGGPSSLSQVSHPRDLAISPTGDLYISDSLNNIVRKVALPGTFEDSIIEQDITYAAPNGLGYVISSTGRHRQTIDLETNTVLKTFGYDPFGNLTVITDQFGNQTTIQRDADGTPLSITSPDGLVTMLAVNVDNQLEQITLPDGAEYNFTYTDEDLLTAKVDPNTHAYHYEYNNAGRIIDVYDDHGGHWSYDRQAGISHATGTLTSGEGNTTVYERGTDLETGRKQMKTHYPDGGVSESIVSTDNLKFNHMLACGMAINKTIGLDPEYQSQYIKEDVRTAPSGLSRVTERDIVYTDTDADDAFDLIVHSTNTNGKTVAWQNNILASTRTIASPEGRTFTSTYDPGTLTTTQAHMPGLASTAYTYYGNGKPETVTTGTRQTSFTYDTDGYLDSITDPRNLTTFFTNDKAGRVTQIDRPDNTSLGFVYDNNGNMTVLTNPSGIDHEFGYNAVDKNSSYATPLSGNYTYTYDKDRRLVQKTFPSGQTIYLDYENPADPDDKSRLWQIITPEYNIDYTYLCGSRVESITRDTETVTYGYDGKLVTSETLSGTLSQTLDYTYNNDFDIDTFTYAGATESYAYDDDGLLTGAGGFTISRYNDPGVNETGLPYNVSNGTFDLSRGFNEYGETSGEDTDISTQNVFDWSITDRYPDGKIKTKTETLNGTAATYDYTYDEMGRLTTVTQDGTLVEEYTYDSLPYGTCTYQMNVLRGISGRTLSYDDEDHLLSTGNANYQYDVDGFLQSKTTGTDTTTYDYSSRGELLSVDLPDGTAIEYLHDPLGRRIAKKIDGTVAEKYLWSGLTTLLAVYDGSDNLLMRFKYADGRMPVAVEKAGVVYYLAYNQVGTLRAVADSAGNIVKQVDYDSWGYVLNDSNPSFEIPFGFAGGLYDKDTGLVRFGYRDYDPDTGRWTAKDPIGFDGGSVDLYKYTLADPINLIDPNGLDWTYSQSTGQISHQPSAAQGGGPPQPIATGYSGHGPGLNNPNMQNTPNVGPIPQGEYTIGPLRNSPNTGPNVMDLTPCPGTNTYNRTDFQIHGDNKQGNQSASKGCIVTDPQTRNLIGTSADKTLKVVQ
ncbi:MAG: RHS repeat-associated core domain-containing protein [Thermodesulfobacteriota bacterium]|nr:RHS repeat-associated core domain-containing protein [Thermodesulfobacteriota bacterium]